MIRAMMPRSLPFIVAVLSATFLSWVSPLQADEIVVVGEHHNKVGDFDCAGCSSEISNAMTMLMGQSSGKVTAGELWQFFNRQGLDSVQQLTFCLDLHPDKAEGSFGLSGINLKIEDPDQLGSLLTNYSTGAHSFVVPEYEISSYKPEARFQVVLGYDFMKRFSANSKEKIHFDFAALDKTSGAPTIFVESTNTALQPGFNLPLLGGFVLFWVIVFVLLSRVTRPTPATSKPTLVTNSTEAYSA